MRKLFCMLGARPSVGTCTRLLSVQAQPSFSCLPNERLPRALHHSHGPAPSNAHFLFPSRQYSAVCTTMQLYEQSNEIDTNSGKSGKWRATISPSPG